MFSYKIANWGLGIGDWAQSPVPNPQYIYRKRIKLKILFIYTYNLKIVNYFLLILRIFLYEKTFLFWKKIF